MDRCDTCNEYFCAACRYSTLSKDWGNACSGCIKLIADKLGPKIAQDKQDQDAKHTAEMNKLLKEIVRLRGGPNLY